MLKRLHASKWLSGLGLAVFLIGSAYLAMPPKTDKQAPVPQVLPSFVAAENPAAANPSSPAEPAKDSPPTSTNSIGSKVKIQSDEPPDLPTIPSRAMNEATRKLNFTPENLPRMDSSTSSQPIAMLTACRVLDYPYHWRRLSDKRMLLAGTQPTTTTSTPGADTEMRTTAFNSKTSKLINSRCTSTGTHAAYRRLISRETDLIIVAREPSEDELKLAKDAKVDFQIKPVARDAFIILINAQNSLKNLTLEQVRDIYTGQNKNWKDLGGNDAPIMAYSRERNSGSLELMEKLVMRGKPIVATRPMIIMSMIGIINRLNDDPQGIGFSLYYYEKHLAIEASDPFLGGKVVKAHQELNRRKIEQNDDGTPAIRRKIIAINGVEPTVKTIADRSYPLVSEVYVVIRREEPAASDPQAVQRTIALRDWLLSPAGQQAVADTGYLLMK